MKQTLRHLAMPALGALLLTQTACMNGADRQLAFSDPAFTGNQSSMHSSRADELYHAIIKKNRIALKYLLGTNKPGSCSELVRKIVATTDLSWQEKKAAISLLAEAIEKIDLTEAQKKEIRTEVLSDQGFDLGIKDLARGMQKILRSNYQATQRLKDVKTFLKYGLVEGLKSEEAVQVLFHLILDTLDADHATSAKVEDLKIVLQAVLPADLDLFQEASIRAVESILRTPLPEEQEKEYLQILLVSIWEHDDTSQKNALQFILNEAINDLDKGRLNEEQAATIAQAILDNKILTKQQGRILLQRLQHYEKSFSPKQYQAIQNRLADTSRGAIKYTTSK